MQTFKIGHLRCISCFHKSLETSLNQSRSSSTENRLLSKKIRFSFLFKRCFQNTGTCGSYSSGPSQSNFFGIFGRSFVYCNQGRHALTLLILRPYNMPGTFWCYHDYTNTSRCLNQAKMNGKPMSK